MFYKLVEFVRAAARAVGEDPALVNFSGGTIDLAVSGVDIWWMENAIGPGIPGWQIRESYLEVDLLDPSVGERGVTEVLACLKPADIYETAKMAWMAAMGHKIDAALGQSASR